MSLNQQQAMEALYFRSAHELHVTTNPLTTDPALFAEACGSLGVKAHVIYNEMPNGQETIDYLTGSEYDCTTAEAFRQLGRIATVLESFGLEVVREKIESTPWHPAAPREEGARHPIGTYFESHFTIPDLPTTHGWKLLRYEQHPFYISTTDNKRRQGLLFATMRHYDSTSAKFCALVDEIYENLAQQVDVSRPTVEFAVYDTNPDHDKKWVESYHALGHK